MSGRGRPAIVLFSGGLDSTTVLAMAMEQGYQCACLSFRYGQRHDIELEKAATLVQAFGIKQHLILNLDLDLIGGSALTDEIPVPKVALETAGKDAPGTTHDIPVTYVPGRNIIFLAHALAWAEVLGALDIFLGINAVDYSGYPDCRPEFLAAFAKMGNLGTKVGVDGQEIVFHAPLIKMGKAEIIQAGMALGVDYSLTHSCYDPQAGLACGACESCQLRLRGFQAAGLTDPAAYVANS